MRDVSLSYTTPLTKASSSSFAFIQSEIAAALDLTFLHFFSRELIFGNDFCRDAQEEPSTPQAVEEYESADEDEDLWKVPKSEYQGQTRVDYMM